jgi:hypothetical protein
LSFAVVANLRVNLIDLAKRRSDHSLRRRRQPTFSSIGHQRGAPARARPADFIRQVARLNSEETLLAGIVNGLGAIELSLLAPAPAHQERSGRLWNHSTTAAALT